LVAPGVTFIVIGKLVMKWVAATSIKTFERNDGKARLFILARDDGFYSFDGFEEVEEDGYTFLRLVGNSGIYETANLAECEAISLTPWLKRQMDEL
jgi:hypothetical protein